MEPKIDHREAVRIACQDASQAYADLDAYEVTAELEDGEWRVRYELRDAAAQGGGPQYVISAETGEILCKRYEQ